MNKLFLIDDDLDDQFFLKEVIESINPTRIAIQQQTEKIALDKLKVSASLPDIIFL